jgi:hypothetical protein
MSSPAQKQELCFRIPLALDVCVHLFCACVVLCAGSGHSTGWSPVQGVLPTVYTITKLEKGGQGPTKDGRAIDGWMDEWMNEWLNDWMIEWISIWINSNITDGRINLWGGGNIRVMECSFLKYGLRSSKKLFLRWFLYSVHTTTRRFLTSR